MSRFFKKVLPFIFITLFYGCSSDIEHYNELPEQFDIKSYFNGPVIAWGMVQDYSNKVTRRFCVEIEGTWQEDSGVLAETFYFDDGEISYRNWQLTKLANGAYQGTAEDVIGLAKGQHKGFAFNWQYSLEVPVKDEVYTLQLDDWMYQIDKYRVFNKTAMNKFGITVADVTLFFDKSKPVQKCQM